MLHAANGLCAGHMCQGGTMHHVTDGVVARHVGLVVVVNRDFSTLKGDAGLFKADILQVGDHTHSAQHYVAVDNGLGVVMPILRKLRLICEAVSSSSLGRICGINSTNVTCTPMLW